MNNISRLSARVITIIVATVILIVVGFLVSAPLPQDPAYHDFADGRRLLQTDNFGNVASNLPFLIFGASGLVYVRRYAPAVCVSGLRPAYIFFFLGVLLTAFGSGYYHLEPNNETLVWDRLSMTIGSTGLFAIIAGEFVSVRLARRILVPLLAAGLFSVVYWAITEAGGNGDLRPYALVQFLPTLIIPIILYSCQPAVGTSKVYWLMIIFYALAKLFEYLDAEIFDLGRLVSGHTLKHLFASLITATLLVELSRRRRAAGTSAGHR
ncbi:MAG: alkaline phytoceramidase [Proteobacteria bacterium]|nr:alkaline phytoceramidase [Pseudomonadota bacterium]